jgi:hypothetical protein
VLPPAMMYLRISSEAKPGRGWYIPLFVVWTLMLPFALLAAALLVIVAAALATPKPRMSAAILNCIPATMTVIAALPGLELDIGESGGQRIEIKIW